MDPLYTITKLPLEGTGLPPDGILSRTLFGDDSLKAVLFEFAQGQELSEHTAATPAILLMLSGEARLTLGPDLHEVQPGAWVNMSARLPHSLLARTPVVMLLLLLEGTHP